MTRQKKPREADFTPKDRMGGWTGIGHLNKLTFQAVLVRIIWGFVLRQLFQQRALPPPVCKQEALYTSVSAEIFLPFQQYPYPAGFDTDM
jgi:hypothetical protein